ncbi:hypothetical protein NKH18_29880 [Streptomyces sp. M10(2022)]
MPDAAGPVQRAKERRPVRPAPTGDPAVQRAVQIKDLTEGVTAGTHGQAAAEGVEPAGVGTVAIVPTKLGKDLNLMEIAEKYEGGFDGGTAPVDRFALVIGVNIRVREPKDAADAKKSLDRKVKEFRDGWGDGRFRVAVLGFSWENAAVRAQKDDQKTTPYGEIRNKIMRSPRRSP